MCNRPALPIALAAAISAAVFRKPSIPGWEYGDWTKLGDYMESDTFVFFVSDRISLVSKYKGLSTVYPAGVAVMAGSRGTGGTSSCSFDYLRIRQLPN